MIASLSLIIFVMSQIFQRQMPVILIRGQVVTNRCPLMSAKSQPHHKKCRLDQNCARSIAAEVVMVSQPTLNWEVSRCAN